jgi:hypothetical protein
MPFIHNIISFILYFAPWLLLFTCILGIIALSSRRRPAGKAIGLCAGLLLLLLIIAFAFGDISWRLIPAFINGYTYHPQTETPDSLLVPRRPDLIIERQLNALIGQMGTAPLSSDSPLLTYQIETVHIDNWHYWPTAVLDTTLTFANGRQLTITITIPTKGGTLINIPFIGEVSRNAYAWYAPESNLAPLLQTAAPVTPIRSDSPPISLQFITTADVTNLPNVNPQTSYLSAADISATGDLLLDVDLREGQTTIGNALLLQSNDRIETLANTFISTRATFAPDGQIAYIRSQKNRPLQLVVRRENGEEMVITAVDWLTQHWLNNHQIAYSHNNLAFLYNLNSGHTFPLAQLPSHEFMGGQHFRVAPDGQRIAYADFDGRIWVKNINSDQQQPIGWNIESFGWASGLTWRDDGQQLLIQTRNTTTLPNQQELYLWDAASDQTRLLLRTGTGFLSSQGNDIRLGQACWLNDITLLIIATLIGYQDEIHLLAADTTSQSVWDVPLPEAFTLPDATCAQNHVAFNTTRTAIALYQINDSR